LNVSSDAPDLAGDRVLAGSVDPSARVPILLFHDHGSLPVGMASRPQHVPDAHGINRLRVLGEFPDAGVSARSDELVALLRAGMGPEWSLGFN
jgi:hypothetical protein